MILEVPTSPAGELKRLCEEQNSQFCPQNNSSGSTVLEFIAAPVPQVRRLVQLTNPDERHWNGIERTRSIYVKVFAKS